MINPDNLESATLEEIQNMFLRPTKFVELAKVLYSMLQIIKTSKDDITDLQSRDYLFESELNDLNERVELLEEKNA